VSSIITSLYPTTNGIKDMPDRLPAGVTTLAEAYRSAGYATFATSSVPFTGRLTNLHQGVEVLHEATSLPDFDHSSSKTSRTSANLPCVGGLVRLAAILLGLGLAVTQARRSFAAATPPGAAGA
jgi:hypothetical protein